MSIKEAEGCGLRPLEGIRIIDLTHVFAGPFCTYQLAVLGADVIKIEPPHEPDMTRIEGVIPKSNENQLGTNFISQNAGKRCLTLNLKKPNGKNILKKMLCDTDVLVQNFSGGKLERMGLGPSELHKINSKLIFCSITGFGRTGPKAHHPAYDNVIQAFSGLMSANGTQDTQPIRVGPPVVDYGTGAQAAMAVCAALFQREKTGKGQVIDVSMLDAALMLMCSSTTDTLATGQSPKVYGNFHPSYAGYAAYPTANGLLMIGAFTNKQLSRLFRVFGEDARADAIEVTSRSEIGKEFSQDTAMIRKYLLLRKAEEWETLLNELEIPAARVRTIDEALKHPQILSRKVIQSYNSFQNESGPSKVLVSAFSYSDGTPSVLSPPPRHGEHTDQILKDLGIGSAEITRLREDKTI